MSEELVTIIMAAGEGKRMDSSLPKVLHPLAGKPLVHHVIDLAFNVGSRRVLLVTGYGREQVRAATQNMNVECVVQEQQLGTGDAVKACNSELDGFSGDLLILSGDVPVLSAGTVKRAHELHKHVDSAATVLTFMPDDPAGYGRIVRAEDGSLSKIVEQKDTSPEEARIREVNGGVYIFKAQTLFPLLELINNANASGEYYLTDCIGILAERGERVAACLVKDEIELAGINTPRQLEELEAKFITQKDH